MTEKPERIEDEYRDPRTFKVEKQGYSHGAWRVLHSDGKQIWANQDIDHPFMGRVVIPGPVCFQRKRDALAWIEQQIAALPVDAPSSVGLVDQP